MNGTIRQLFQGLNHQLSKRKTVNIDENFCLSLEVQVNTLPCYYCVFTVKKEIVKRFLDIVRKNVPYQK